MASCNCLLCYVDTYVDNFVTMEQGGPRLWHQVHRHLFHDIYCVILPNNVDKSSQKDPNLNKKLCCSDTTWTICKQVLGWLIDILRHQINPPLLLTIQFYLRPGQVPPWPTINHLPPVGMACCYFVQNHTRPIKRWNSVCLYTMGPQPDRHPHLTYAWVPQWTVWLEKPRRRFRSTDDLLPGSLFKIPQMTFYAQRMSVGPCLPFYGTRTSSCS